MEARFLRLVILLGVWILTALAAKGHTESVRPACDHATYTISTAFGEDAIDQNRLQEHIKFGQHRLRNKITSHQSYTQALEQLEEIFDGNELRRPVKLLYRLVSCFTCKPSIYSHIFSGSLSDCRPYDMPLVHRYIVFQDFRI